MFNHDNRGDDRRTDCSELPTVEKDQLSWFYDVLSDYRRRYVLYYLHEEEQTSVEDLATQLSAWDQGCGRSELSDTDCDQVAAELHHQHLPQLDQTPVIEYDQERKRVMYDNPPPGLESLISYSMEWELEEV